MKTKTRLAQEVSTDDTCCYNSDSVLCMASKLAFELASCKMPVQNEDLQVLIPPVHNSSQRLGLHSGTYHICHVSNQQQGGASAAMGMPITDNDHDDGCD
jgi:hypothetical protein